MSAMHWLMMAAVTDPGRIREQNEDAVHVDPDAGVALLADGMGGYNAGEVASGMTVSLLGERLGDFMRAGAVEMAAENAASWVRQALTREIGAVNHEVLSLSRREAQYAGMGTTLVACCFYRGHLSVAHLGDSRLYRLRGRDLLRLTKDHSLLQIQIDAGIISEEEARYAENKNLVTRALGVEPEIEIDIGEYEVSPGDLYLLCSDGLNDMLDDTEIRDALLAIEGGLDQRARHLVNLANEAGGRDNISVVLVEVDRKEPDGAGWWQRLMDRLMH